MTQTWDLLDDGSLAVWTHTMDASTDSPASTHADFNGTWDRGSYPDEVVSLLYQHMLAEIRENNQSIDWGLEIMADVDTDDIVQR